MYGGDDGQGQLSGKGGVTQGHVDVEVDAHSQADADGHVRVAHGGDDGRWSAKVFGERHRKNSGAGR